jgi:hypothetical protein
MEYVHPNLQPSPSYLSANCKEKDTKAYKCNVYSCDGGHSAVLFNDVK